MNTVLEEKPGDRTGAVAANTAYGLIFHSEIAVPFHPAPFGAEPDVIIRRGTAPRRLDGPVNGTGRWWEAAPGAFLLTVEDVARYFVRAGNEIVIDSSGNERDARVFLLGSALAACLQQRGIFTLHASAVETAHGAVLFLGEPGVGKSTLAAALVDRGLRLMADDVTGILVREGRPVALPAFPSLRLWADVMKELGRQTTGSRKVREGIEKYDVAVEGFCGSPLPVRAMFLLGLRNNEDLRLQAVPRTTAVDALLFNTYRKRIALSMGCLPEAFRAATALARHAPLFELLRPDDRQHPALWADMVERHLETLAAPGGQQPEWGSGG